MSINLNSGHRFVETKVLREAYLSYDESLSPKAPNFVELDDNLELGIVSSQVPQISNAVSSILSRSLEDVKNSNEGYLPDSAVTRVQENIISPAGVSDLWGTTGHRFVMSRHYTSNVREIVASILVGRSKDTIFFFTGRYNNLRYSTIKTEVDLNQPDGDDPNKKWFDRFAFPDLERFKPIAYHQIANFVVNKEDRGRGLARVFLDNIVKHYSRDYISKFHSQIVHSQHLLCGRGLWQIGDPPWLPKMQALGFYRRVGAESFFIEQDWAPLPPIYWKGEKISNTVYNEVNHMPEVYENNLFISNETDQHMLDRIPEVIRLSKDPRAKLQYFQVMYNFI